MATSRVRARAHTTPFPLPFPPGPPQALIAIVRLKQRKREMRKSTTVRMDDYDAVVMGVLEPILVLSVMAVVVVLLGGAITYEPPCERIVRELHRDGIESSCKDLAPYLREISPLQPPPASPTPRRDI